MSRVRRTKQREAILNTILSAEGPLAVGQIHERASDELPGLGIATVYRALNLLLEEGKVVVVSLPGEERRYEAAGIGHHHHFRCSGCGGVFDLEVCPVGVPRGTRLPGGYTVEEHHLTLYGRCPACARG
ncbi:transcriptional repressor [Rubrobacter taiwanensis]|uniref:Transcriptional repressor n=1 Tax=Rubrobacter taiwanensis TaxID=185139 RepID=A0A4V2NWH3_9ACTN|nr:transcriptional repressor [Rubrobacter taiwanensis]TCJ17352.1 transcriptional repressor [Rubrobacter taiwanensis]